jgi:hypothetical protein
MLLLVNSYRQLRLSSVQRLAVKKKELNRKAHKEKIKTLSALCE